MIWLDRWDIVLLALSAYVVVMALVRLMAGRRRELVADVERQIHAQRKRGKHKQSADGQSDAA